VRKVFIVALLGAACGGSGSMGFTDGGSDSSTDGDPLIETGGDALEMEGGGDDGVVEAGGDGGAPLDAAMEAAPPTKYFVFMTSQTFDAALGGIAGADGKCNAAAKAGGLPGTYKAWLSTTATWPALTFTKSAVPYVLPDGTTQIQTDWSHLTAGAGLLHDLDEDEYGTKYGDAGSFSLWSWTSTHPDGTFESTGGDCVHFTSNVLNYTDEATCGCEDCDPNMGLNRWTVYCAHTCNMTARLLCFQQ
jgi:hypothetical protein